MQKFTGSCRRPLAAALALGLAGLMAAGCKNDSGINVVGTTTLLDTTVNVISGVNCNTGGVQAEFEGEMGTTVTISASAAATLTPFFVLYAPDFSTQLAASEANGDGKAKLTFALLQSGTHHVTACEQNGRAGAVRLTVTTPKE